MPLPGVDLRPCTVMFTRHSLRIRDARGNNHVIAIPVVVEPERYRATRLNGVIDAVVERYAGGKPQ